MNNLKKIYTAPFSITLGINFALWQETVYGGVFVGLISWIILTLVEENIND